MSMKKPFGGVFSQEGYSRIYVSKKFSRADRNYSNRGLEALATVFVVTKLKQLCQLLLGRRFTLQTEDKPLKNLFAPEEEILRTESARITRWATAPMVFDFELMYTPGEAIPHADAFSRMNFDDDESDNDRVCFAINSIHFAQCDLAT